MGFLDGLIKGVSSGAIEGIGKGAKSIIQSLKADPTETMRAEQDLKILIQNNVIKAKEIEAKKREKELVDRNSARDMYKDDSILQKIFSLTFLIGYMGMVGFVLYSIFIGKSFPSMENWIVVLITTLVNTLSNKLNTIIEFFFAGNVKKDVGLDLVAIKKQEEQEKIKKLKRKCKAQGLDFDEDDTVEELQDLLEDKKK